MARRTKDTSPDPGPVSRSRVYTLYAVVVVVGAAVMAFEILTSRVIAPYFGSSVYTWGNLIGVILSAMALGYWLGGRLTHTHADGRLPAYLLWTAALLITPLPYFASFVAAALDKFSLPHPFNVLVALIVLCLVPAALLTAIFPIAAHRAADWEESVGKLTGKIGIASTAGSLAGTFLATLVLVNVEWLGTRRSLYLTGAAVLLCGVAMLFLSKNRKKASLPGAVAGLAAIVLQLAALKLVWWAVLPPLRPNERLIEERDTPYHTVRVVEIDAANPYDNLAGTVARLLRFSDPQGSQSGVFLELPDQVSAIAYTDLMFAPWAFADIRKVAIIGAGGGIITRDLLRALAPDAAREASVDVVDVDEYVFSAGERYFGYPRKDPRVKSHVEDGRMFFRRRAERYDLVALDAYTATGQIPEHLISREFLQEVKSHLNPGGVVAMNLYIYDPKEETLREASPKYLAVLKTFHQVFPPARTHVFATALWDQTWRNEPVLDTGNVVLIGVEGMGEILPDFTRLGARLTSFRGLRPLSAFAFALYSPNVTSAMRVAYEKAPILTDDFNPINVMGR